MPVLTPSPKQQFTDNAGNLAVGYKLYTYAAGTTNPLATYQDRAGASANTNPIILNARGEATIYLQEDKSYDFKFESPDGSMTWTQPGVETQDGRLRGDLASDDSGKGAALINVGGRSVADFLSDRINAKAAGAKGDGKLVKSATTIAAGSTALTVAGGTFTAADVGKAIEVQGAGAAGAFLYATITAVSSATQVTLSAAAATALAASVQNVIYGTDDSAAFQAIIDAMPVQGAQVDIPNGIYMIQQAYSLRWNTKSVTWNIGAGTLFAGAYGSSASLLSFPRANTNETLIPTGIFVQSRNSTALHGGNTTAPAAAIFEGIQIPGFQGNTVGLYAGARGGNANGYVWAANILVHLDPGAGGTFHGIELDCNNFSANPAAKLIGLGISGIGDTKGTTAIEIQHGMGWKYGVTIQNCENGIYIQGGVGTGITVGNPAYTSPGAVMVGRQLQNGAEAIVLQRFTDSVPSGKFISAYTLGGVRMFEVDINGGVVASSLTTSGTTDTYNLALRFPAPATIAGTVGLGNGTSTTVGAAGGASAPPATPAKYWTINADGATYKIPLYNV